MAINYISRKDSAWMVISLKPDVCKTPRGDSTPPIPYSVTANMDASLDTVPSVKANDRPVLVLDQSYIPQTQGDQPGTAKGVASGTVGDICEPLQHSKTVKVGGKAVLRHNDIFWMNSRNTIGMIFGQPPAARLLSGSVDPDVKPETPEEKSFLDTLFSAFAHEGESRRNATQNMADARDAWSDAFTDHTNDGTMNSEAIGRMLYASGYYGLSPETARNIARQIGGEALQTYEAIDTPENRGLMIAAQSIAGAALLSKANGMIGGRDGANVKGKKQKQGDEGDGTCSKYGTCEGDPVNVGTGDFLQELSVLTLPGSLPLTLSRFYRSRATGGGIFGPKWTDDWSVSLKIVGRNLHFTDHEGVVLYYPIAQDGVFNNAVNSRQANLRLSGKLGKTLSLFDRHSRQTRCFAPAEPGHYRLCALHDTCGNRAEFIHTDGRLTAIQHSDGHTLALDWQDGQLRNIDLVAPQPQRLVTCEYDDHGYLAGCDTFQFSRLWHAYSPDGLMIRWQDTDKTCVDIGYDSLGRAIRTRSTAGYYDDRFLYDDDARCTTYLDAEGGETRYWYDDDGLVTRCIDPLGRESLTVRENTRLISHTDALGRTTAYDYNDDGDVSRVSLPGGHSLYYVYNNGGQLTRLTAPGSQVWQWHYDDKGSMVSLTDPQGRVQQFSYSDHGDLLAQILPGGATWQWQYDALHQVCETTAPDGGVTKTGQDVLGRLLSVQDPLGHTTQFRQSKTHAGPQGSVEETLRPDGVRELMRQNSEKLPESYTDGEGRITRYEYGAFDLLTALVRPDGERLECRYDRLTRLTDIINAEGDTYHLTYDVAGQLIAETDFTGRTLTYTYDAAGRCTRTTFPDGTHLNRRYNVTDQLTDEFVTRGDSDRTLSATTFRHDTRCRLVEAKNDAATVTYEYDDASRVTAETLNGRRTEYQYDAHQDVITQRTTDGRVEQFHHGPTGEMTWWQLNEHAPLAFEHDLCGQEISRESTAGFGLRQGWTPGGLLTTQHVGNPDILSPHYRRNNIITRQYLYDRAYNLTMLSDAHRGTMVNSLTINDQIFHTTWTGSSDIPMREERFTYDKNLNITGRETLFDEVPDSETHQQQLHGRVVSHQHNAWRQTKSRFHPKTGLPQTGKFTKVIRDEQTTLKYDGNGRLAEKIFSKQGHRALLWRYRWDAKNQLTGLETPDGERWEYQYDPFGRRISKRCTNRDKPGMDFHWQGDQLTAEIPVSPDGTPSPDHAIRWIYKPGSFTPLARYENGQLLYAVTDTTGRIQELLTEDGTVVWWGRQQLWGREEGRQKDGAPTCRLRFPGQYEDDESGLFYNRFRYYDCDTGQYLSADPVGLAGGLNLYQYAPNPLGWIDPLGLAKTCSPKKVKQLQEGPAGTVVYVRSKKEANELLNAAFPDFQKVKGLGHQKMTGGNVQSRIQNKQNRFEKTGRAYHKDYAIGKDGRPVLHKPGPEWHEYPHIDINRGTNGVKDIVHIAIQGVT